MSAFRRKVWWEQKRNNWANLESSVLIFASFLCRVDPDIVPLICMKTVAVEADVRPSHLWSLSLLSKPLTFTFYLNWTRQLCMMVVRLILFQHSRSVIFTLNSLWLEFLPTIWYSCFYFNSDVNCNAFLSHKEAQWVLQMNV